MKRFTFQQQRFERDQKFYRRAGSLFPRVLAFRTEVDGSAFGGGCPLCSGSAEGAWQRQFSEDFEKYTNVFFPEPRTKNYREIKIEYYRCSYLMMMKWWQKVRLFNVVPMIFLKPASECCRQRKKLHRFVQVILGASVGRQKEHKLSKLVSNNEWSLSSATLTPGK